MSIEVRARQYLFIPSTGPTPVPRCDRAAILARARGIKPTTPDASIYAPKGKKHTWFYNPLHDFESIFWLAVHFFTNRDIRCVSELGMGTRFAEGGPEPFIFEEESDEHRKKRLIGHWDFGRSLFAGRSGRPTILFSPAKMADFLVEYPLHPAIAPFGNILETMRNQLVSSYIANEQNVSQITHESAKEVALVFAEQLFNANDHIQRVLCRLEVHSLKQAIDALPKSTVGKSQPSISKGASASAGTKRRRNDDDDEYVDGAQARKSKSPRASASHKSPTSILASTKGRKAGGGKRRTANGKRAPAGRKLPTSAPFSPPAPQPTTVPTHDPPPPPPQPPTRVLRSQTRNVVARNLPSPPDPPPAVPVRKMSTAAGRKTRGVARAKETAKAAAKVANKSVPKRKPRTRTARGS